MTKQHFIALADHISYHRDLFTDAQIESLADFCQSQNSQFKRDRWIAYIKGECEPNGGTPKTGKRISMLTVTPH